MFGWSLAETISHNAFFQMVDPEDRESVSAALPAPLIQSELFGRASDIPLLVWHFVNEFNSRMGKSIERIPKPAMDRLVASFPRYSRPDSCPCGRIAQIQYATKLLKQLRTIF